MTDKESTTDVYHKALTINLDPGIYGTIAEIGAGQEVSRWFFHVGGAAGTIAKTMSAYDMTISDQIYGKGTRYVSKERALAMLKHEYDLLVERLGDKRGTETSFFVFADTVAARNYRGTNECHGWIGLRFQTTPLSEPNDILIHVNMHDPTNALQQNAIGVLGVNLIYGAYVFRNSREQFLKSLLDGLTEERLEIDTVIFSGPDMKDVCPIDVGVAILRNQLGNAVLLDAHGNLIPPTEVLHNRPLVVLRGKFETPPSEIHRRMLEGGSKQICLELTANDKKPVRFFEMNTADSPSADLFPEVTKEQIGQLLECGELLLLTQFRENYLLTRYLRRFVKDQPIRFVIGVTNLVSLFETSFYKDLPGQLLEGIAKFLAENVKVYVKSMTHKEFEAYFDRKQHRPATFRLSNEELVTVENLEFDPPFGYLFNYLRALGTLVRLEE